MTAPSSVQLFRRTRRLDRSRMEETQPTPRPARDRSEQTAAKLRALREQAASGLQQHQQQLASVEAEIERRVAELAAEFDGHTAAEWESKQRQLAELQAVVDGYEQQLAEFAQRAHGVKDKFDATLAAKEEELVKLRDEVADLRRDLAAQGDGGSGRDQAVEQLQGERDRLQAQRDQLQRERDQLHGERDQLQSERDQLQGERDQFQSERDQLQGERDQARGEAEQLRNEHDELRDERDQLSSQRDELREQLDEQISESLADTSKHEQELANLESRAQQLKAQFDESSATRDEALASAQQEAESLREQAAAATTARDESSKKANDLEAECEKLRRQLDDQLHAYAELQGQTCEACEAAQGQLSESQSALAEAQQNAEVKQQEVDRLQHEVDGFRAELAEAQQQQSESAEKLTEAQAQIDQLQAAASDDSELQQLQEKFELALADVQKVKQENADLREQLASRPEVDEQPSAELIALRTERDDLAAKVEALEQMEPPAADLDLKDELADVQRRFEMAVEDLRTIKQENADLQEQLAAKPAVGAAPAPIVGDALDWESQKARLLAELEGEATEGPIEPQRQAVRATVEGTIATTDQVVAEKDRKIADLESQLESQLDEQASGEDALEAEKQEILDANEVVSEEIARLEALQEEWAEKVRKAELELSVERAQLARERAKMEERLATASDEESAADSDGKPRRRWLAALGLKEDQDDKAD